MPGRTTHVVLEPAAIVESWWVDDVALYLIPDAVPGDPISSLSDRTPLAQHVPRWRGLVAPGRHVIRYAVAGKESAQTIDIGAGLRLVVVVE